MEERMNIANLKSDLVRLNAFIYFDDNDYLREKCSNDKLLREILIKFEIAIESVLIEESELPADKLFLYGNIGNLYRLVGNTDLAIKSLQKAIEISDEKRQISNLIRLGEALKYDGQHEQALKKFKKAIDICATNNGSDLLDFAYQHKGKCLLELGQRSLALGYFEKAMELRLVKAEQPLIESTRRAINFIENWGGM